MENGKTSLNIRKLKKQVKGITLIALVVTIIVLLILAGIALNLTIGQNGIFSRAQTAANTWRNAESNEQLAIGELEEWIDETINGPQAEEGTLAWMYEQAIKDGCPGGESCTDPENHLHIGDYVNFEDKVNEYLEKQEDNKISVEVVTADTGMQDAQHYEVNSTTNQLRWRVLGYNDENGDGRKEILLKAELPLQTSDDGNNGMLYMCGAEAYLNGSKRMDEICREIYGNVEKVTNARSMKIEDITRLFNTDGINSEEFIKSKDILPTMNGSPYNYGDSLDEIRGATPNDLINYMRGKNISCSEEYDSNSSYRTEFTGQYNYNLTDEEVTGYAYIIKEESMELPGGMPANLSEKIINTDAIKYDLIFKNATAGTSGAYWLSSPGVFADSDIALFGPGAVYIASGLSIAISGYYAFHSNGFVNVYGFGLCPVVSLESDVLATEISKVN